MEPLQVERRAQHTAAHGTAFSPAWHRIVQAGIVLQAQAGTISAVEYLKSHDVAGAVIARVLSGGHRRAEDRAAMELRTA